MIKSFESKVFGKLNIEIYHSANAVVDDLQARQKTSGSFKKNEYEDTRWVGANREDTYRMLREGYQPTVDKMKSQMRFTASGVGKRTKFANHVEGFAPIVPNAILGLPNSMVTSYTKPIKTKVIDIYYEMTASCLVDSDDLIKAGQKLLRAIMALEAQGYRFNLYVVQDYFDEKTCDMLCVRVKSANQPFDLKRMSFPCTHTAFFRGIGFEWYSKFPLGTYRSGYVHSVSYTKTQEVISAEFKRLFGPSAVFFACTKLIDDEKNEEYIKGVLTNDKK